MNDLSNTTLTALVKYKHPSFEMLKHQFPAYVNPDYRDARFDPIERCKAVSRESRRVTFEYVYLGRNASTREVLAEMDRNGLLPAGYEELFYFDVKFPNEKVKFPIIALGSEANVDGDRSAAYMWCDDEGWSLGLRWVGHGWDKDCRFLAVRK